MNDGSPLTSLAFVAKWFTAFAAYLAIAAARQPDPLEIAALIIACGAAVIFWRATIAACRELPPPSEITRLRV
jgi:hypothetical protein